MFSYFSNHLILGGFRHLFATRCVELGFDVKTHLFATRCVELGFDVKTLSEILGHSSVEVTLNRYIHSDMERKRTCMSLLSKCA